MTNETQDSYFYVVFHGHFYQPPRENPWIESIEKQPSAYPFHDWDERIAYECYIPNGCARVKNEKNQTVDIVNNYAYINFDFGPTLLDWYAARFKDEYQWILEADQVSRQIHGSGNVIAQVYNHVIMPLANRRDKITQVRWGIREFSYHFRRQPEAMWLPETACNLETIEVLIAEGMRFLILAPSQALRIRPLGKKEWIDTSQENIDPKRPYRLFLRDAQGQPHPDKYIDIFFYDGALSRAVSFEDITKNSFAFAERIQACFDKKRQSPQVVSVVTDGESYGHHKTFADMTLAHAVKYELPKRGMRVVNYSTFLKLCPPRWEVEIKPGENSEGTSWSCSHGVRRWKDDCGCSTYSQAGWNQKWRAPFRAALDILRDQLCRIFEQEGSRYLHDVWKARDEYIDVILDRSESSIGRFFKAHLKVQEEGLKVKVLKLLEMQRHAMLIYTSCGWYFADISGIETVQNLKYAARAIQLAREITGEDLEKVFLPVLAQAISNVPQWGTGQEVYEKLVRPSVVTKEQVVSHYVICLLFGRAGEGLYHYRIRNVETYKKEVAGISLFCGHVRLTCGITLEEDHFMFLVTYLGGKRTISFVERFRDAQWYEGLRQALVKLDRDTVSEDKIEEIHEHFFTGQAFGLPDLFIDDREDILSIILHDKTEKLKSIYAALLEEYFPLLEEFSHAKIPIPDDLKQEIGVAFTRRLALLAEDLKMHHTEGLLKILKGLVEKAMRFELKINWTYFEANIKQAVLSLLKDSIRLRNSEKARFLLRMLETVLPLNLQFWRSEAEDLLFRFYLFEIRPQIEGAEFKHTKDLEFTRIIVKIAGVMGFEVTATEEKLKQASLKTK